MQNVAEFVEEQKRHVVTIAYLKTKNAIGPMVVLVMAKSITAKKLLEAIT